MQEVRKDEMSNFTIRIGQYTRSNEKITVPRMIL